MLNLIELEVPVAFTPLWGEPLLGLAHSLSEDEGEVRLEFTVPGPTFARIATIDAFVFVPEMRTVGRAEALDPTEPVRLVLRLRQAVSDLAAQLGDVGMTVAKALGDDTHPLGEVVIQSEAWVLCRASQRFDVPDDPDAEASHGIGTAWDF